MASTSSNVKVGKYKIEKFNGKNDFFYWRMQIKNLLRKLELSLPYEEFLKNVDNNENNARYKELYEIIVSSPSYRVGKKISKFFDFLHLKNILLKFYYLLNP